MPKYKNTTLYEEFWTYLKSSVSYEIWKNLQMILKCSPHHLTKLQNGNLDFSFAEIETLAKLLDMNPVDLSDKYRLGYGANTVAQIEKFATRHKKNVFLTFVSAA